MIWYQKELSIDDLNKLGTGTMAATVGIEFTEMGADFLTAKMPVNHNTKQPFGLLHGGASAVLAETLGSVAAWLCVNPIMKACVGLELNCNHIKGVRDGYVYGRVSPVHIGGSTQVWNIVITNENNKIVCVSRLTIAVINLVTS